MPPRDYLLLLGAAAGALAALVSNSVGVSFVGRPAQAVAAQGHPTLELFREVYQLVHERHVISPDDSKLIEGAIKGLMGELDPHSEYLNAQTFRTIQEEALAWISTAHNLPNILAFSALLDQAERAAAGRRRVLRKKLRKARTVAGEASPAPRRSGGTLLAYKVLWSPYMRGLTYQI